VGYLPAELQQARDRIPVLEAPKDGVVSPDLTAFPRRWWLFAESLLVGGLLVGALWVFTAAAGRVEIQGDESRYMWAGRYFEYLFVQRDITRTEWGDGKYTHTQPMLVNYLVGGWLWARGYSADRALAGYDWTRNWWANLRAGRVPNATVLAEARRPMVLFAVATVGALYVLGRLLGGPIAGLTTAVLALGSPIVQRELIQVRSEAPLALLMVLGVLLMVLGVRRGRDGSLSLRWAVAVGLTLGLGFAMKLTAALSLVAVAGWAVLMVLTAAVYGRSSGLTVHLGRAWMAGRGWVLVLVVALGVFVLCNPHLYPDPLLHTAHLFQRRAQEMQQQRQDHPEASIDSPLDRPSYVLGGSLVWGTLIGSRGLMLEASLATVGLAALLMRAWRGWRGKARTPADELLLLLMLSYFAGVSAGASLAYARYLLPTLFLGAVLSGLGAAVLLAQVAEIRALLRRCLLAAPAPAPPARL
jgi:hypothetical protein